jgi:hypothetical protein
LGPNPSGPGSLIRFHGLHASPLHLSLELLQLSTEPAATTQQMLPTDLHIGTAISAVRRDRRRSDFPKSTGTLENDPVQPTLLEPFEILYGPNDGDVTPSVGCADSE